MNRKQGLTYFELRIAACLTLTAYVFAFSGLIANTVIKTVLGIIGYATIPLLAFIIDESFKHTNNYLKMFIRNLVLALICAYPYRFAFANAANLADIRSYFSCALTAFLMAGSLYLYDRMKTKMQRIFCVAFLTAMTLLVGAEFSPYLPLLVFIIHIFRIEQTESDEKKLHSGDKELEAQVTERKYELSRTTFIKYAYCVVTFAIVTLIVTLLFSKTWEGYGEMFGSEVFRNYCMPGMILALPVVRYYNGERGVSSLPAKIAYRVFYPLLLATVVLLKIFT